MGNKSQVGSNIIAFLVMLVGIGLIITFIVLSSKNNEEMFISEKIPEGKQLYERLMELSNENYPETPEETVKMFGNAYMLLYGNFLKDESHYNEILMQQRLLYDNELLDLNSLEMQEIMLKDAIDTLKKDKFYIVNFETLPAVYSLKNNQEARVRVKMNGSDFSDIYWNYYLKKDENSGKWKITAWKQATSEYKDMESLESDAEEKESEPKTLVVD
ncbi:MAG: hypothetical protein IJ583_03850 [Firmicutes bacterium]|nr:hypothetical protein [Bacillota bacterium]